MWLAITKGLKESRLEGNHPALSRLSDIRLDTGISSFLDEEKNDKFVIMFVRDYARLNPRGDEQRDIEIKSAPSRQDTNRGEHVESDESRREHGETLPRVEFRPLLPSLRSSTSSCLFRIWTNYADGNVRGDFDSPRWLACPDMSDFTWGIRELEKLTRPDLVECQLFRRELRLNSQVAESKQYIPHEYILLTDRNDTSGRSFNRCESLEAFLISEVFQVLGGYWIPKSNICRKITMNHQLQQLSHEFPTMMTRLGRAKQKRPQVRF
ncbi:hypothetical protein ALC60_07618 [Trachymyrmex zeteki]|uniref:Uncharacterized protein n=1 Tax=Mycetomoellerius zeteki TaxID=64791 RepID=A0A151WZE1_9HYME|nr:hypothetical protein ALC60_07618 [Trachymyrmex zeteki]